jgi:RNA-binding protein 26
VRLSPLAYLETMVLTRRKTDNGYCARGAFCRFSHGDDAVVPSQLYAMNNNPMGAAGMPFLPMFVPGPMPFPMAGPGVAYDPHEARMDMRPPTLSMGPGGRSGHRVPIMPRMNPEAANMIVQDGGELPVIQDLTPAALPDEAIPVNIAQDQFDVGNGNNYPPVTNMQLGGQMPVNGSLDVDMMPPPSLPAHPTGKFRSPARPERTRGTFDGDANSLRPDRRNDTTLVVEKIPEDSLSLESVNAWFKRFGAVTKVAIDPRNAKALVSFSDHKEAHAAWKSQEAVFNNRFVKLFWHRPMEGHGQTGARMLAASAPLVANMAAKEKAATSVSTSSQEPAIAGNAAAKPTPPRKTPASSALPATALAAKKELLDRQIAEQKALMVSYESASLEEKKRIMARHRELGEEMKAASSPTPVQTPAKTPVPATQLPSDRERQERERLDKELEMHAAATPAGDSTSDLQAKLATLKAEVSLQRSTLPSTQAS